MTKEDPLHRLSRTPTNASRQQQWSVWKEAEKERTREIKLWGTAESPAPRSSPTRTPHQSAGPSTAASTTPRKTPVRAALTTSSAAKPTTPKRAVPVTNKTGTHHGLNSNVKQSADTGASHKKSAAISVAQKPPEPKQVSQLTASKIELLDKAKAMQLFDRLDENASGKLSLAELDKGIVSEYPEMNNKPAIMRAYHATDASGDGFVSRDEFHFFLSYMAYYNNLWSLFSALDEDGDRRISKDEFLSAAAKLDLDRDAETVFGEVDDNGGGMILFDELCAYMAQAKSGWGLKDSDVEAVTAKLTLSDKVSELVPEDTQPAE